MGVYANLKIRGKLLLGYAVVVIITFTIGIFGYLQIHKLDHSNTILYEQATRPLEHIGLIGSLFQRLRANIREMVLSKDASRREYYVGRISQFRQEIDVLAKELEQELPDAEARRMFATFVRTRNDYGPQLLRVIELAKVSGDEAMAFMQSDKMDVTEHAEITAIETLQHYLVVNAEKVSKQNAETARVSGMIMLGLALGAAFLAACIAILITRSIVKPLLLVLDAIRSQQEGGKEKARLVEAIASGDLSQQMVAAKPLNLETEQTGTDETGLLLRAVIAMSEIQAALDQSFARMAKTLRRNRDEEELRNWFKNGQNELNTILRGDKPLAELTGSALSYLTKYLGAGVGVFYLYEPKQGNLQIAATYAFTRRKRLNERIVLGEGLAGQAALERQMICLNEAPADYLPIGSAIGEAKPMNIVDLPLLHNEQLVGVLEIGSFAPFSDNELEFLKQSMEGLAISISVNRSRQLVNELLAQTQAQAEELQAQTEELRVQQEELQQTNEELEERAHLLEQQREQIRLKNLEVERVSLETQRKAEELERVSTYKSEFLANMSHELRTPLNSLMILSSLLKENKEGNLTDKQVEFAATINGAGRDLLNLINDILDLSKIESGHLDFQYEELRPAEMGAQLETIFRPLAEDKGVGFTITTRDNAPPIILADGQRSLQIVKNLLSNAFKFTEKGSVGVEIYTPAGDENPLAGPAVAFAVRDTGIGIATDKLEVIFNAFQQADGSTSRKFGGTGLGLSISRQLARYMQGEIIVSSTPGVGSCFTLYLPVTGLGPNLGQNPKVEVKPLSPPSLPKRKKEGAVQVPAELPEASIPDDRQRLTSGERSILIIEDDLAFAGILLDMVRARGFAGLVAADGESGIALAEHFQPSAVILDVMLPHIDGWGVMRSLKDNPQTRHIPVHFITCLEERQKALTMGAIGFVTKPVSSQQLEEVFGNIEQAIAKTVKKLLIVEDNRDESQALTNLLAARDVVIHTAASGSAALAALAKESFDCIVLDLGLGDMSAFNLLEHIKGLDPHERIPIIIHTGKELGHEEELKLRRYAESIIVKGAKSPDRLLNEVTLFLHLVETSLAPEKQRMIRTALDKEAMLAGKKVLIADDDMRNIFSLTNVLADKEMQVVGAENGREALAQLEKNPDIDVVLMDIMMPEMDGYEAIRKIRQDPRFKALPIIALTAKAMKGDREECLQAGASDYIPKPVDTEKLFSLLRVWLYGASCRQE
jgi:CheY-like chemotaxis protein/signal transduction histidine kinase